MVPTPPGWKTEPADWLPSPQSTVTRPAPVKSDNGAFRLASVNVATWAARTAPSVATTGVPVAGKLASVIVKVMGLGVPPPGGGLKTVTLAVPSSARSAAGSMAWGGEVGGRR